MPPKNYYVLGGNWCCYIEPSEEDRLLAEEDLLIEVSTKAVEAYFGERQNDTLTVLDQESEAVIGILLAVSKNGNHKNEDDFEYVPSHLALGNSGKYKASQTAFDAYVEFRKMTDEALKKKAQSKKKKSSKKLPPTPPPLEI